MVSQGHGDVNKMSRPVTIIFISWKMRDNNSKENKSKFRETPMVPGIATEYINASNGRYQGTERKMVHEAQQESSGYRG